MLLPAKQKARVVLYSAVFHQRLQARRIDNSIPRRDALPLDEMAMLIASIKQKRKGKLYARVAYIEGNIDGFRYCDSLNSSNYLTYIYLYGRLGLDVPAFIMDEYYPKSF